MSDLWAAVLVLLVIAGQLGLAWLLLGWTDQRRQPPPGPTAPDSTAWQDAGTDPAQGSHSS